MEQKPCRLTRSLIKVQYHLPGTQNQARKQNQEAQELQAKAQEIEQTFPILDQNSTNYDEGLTKEVMELRDAFMVQGYGAADSLARATEYTLAAKRPELLFSVGKLQLCFFYSYGLSHSNFSLQVGIWIDPCVRAGIDLEKNDECPRVD